MAKKKTSRQAMLPGMSDESAPAQAAPKSSSPTAKAAKPAPAASRKTAPAPAADDPASADDDVLAGKTIYVIDAHSLIFQVFHAIPEMTGPRGEPVNAVFGFTRDILYLLREKQPDYLLCAFDTSGPTFRDEIYEEYKANREEMPNDLVPQIECIREMLDALAIPILELSGYEADDILATVARLADEAGADCLLVTGDKDCRQLITDHVKVYNVRKDLIYDAGALMGDWGIRPDQVVDFQSLVGDSVDNVPGVPLIGPKIAGQLLTNFDTLEGVFEHVEEISGKKRKENLIAGQEQALLSRQLVRLDPEVPVEVDWSAGRVGGINSEAAMELCSRFGFRRIADEIESLDIHSYEAPWDHTYHLVDTPEAFEAFLKQLSEQRRFSFDTETTHIRARWADVVGYAFCWQAGEAWYVPVRAPQGEPQLDPDLVLEKLRPILESRQIKKIGQNLKYDNVVLRNAGVPLGGAEFDTMVASYLLSSGERTHNLDLLARKYLKHTTIKIEELIGAGKNQKRMDEVSPGEIAEYAGEDADVPLRLEPLLAGKLQASELEELFHNVEMPLVEVLADLEYTGIKVDPQRLADLSAQYTERLDELEREIYQLAGREFNIGSPKQLQEILFSELNLPVVKRKRTGASTDASVLEELAVHHELPRKILEYRQFAKLKNTYVDALPALIHPQTGRIHASFNQQVTATGRLSSSDPNLQNIPVRTQRGREIRSAFLPGQPDWLLLAADYSQIELRVLAHFSEDKTLCQAFADDADIHALVASQVNNVPLAEVTSEMRRAAKAVNFGVIYGQSPWGLAKQLGIEKDQAAEFIDGYFDRYPGVEEFLAKILEGARANGYVNTILGRRRAIQGIRRTTGRQRNLSERTAINTVIQGSAADLIKLAMIAIHGRLREGFSARMLLQIHDELVFELPPTELDQLAQLVSEEMSGVLPLKVPLKVDLGTGPNWFDIEPLPA